MLKKIVSQFHNSRNIQEKRKLIPILENLKEFGYKSEHVYASYGEDSAAIRFSPNSEDLILLTTDALLPEFVQKSPWGAGYSAIYVGIDDIMACGGTPLACSVTVAFNEESTGKEIMRGINDATNAFEIPLVRGHTSTDSVISLTSTIIGKSTISSFLSAGGTKIGDNFAIIWDSQGHPGKANRNYWDTITMKSASEFYHKRSFIKTAIRNGYLHACKDISNGGILGTLYQMVEFATVGAEIELDQLELNLQQIQSEYTMIEFLFLYLTSAFLVSFPPEAELFITKLVKDSAMNYIMLGTATQSREIKLKFNTEEYLLI